MRDIRVARDAIARSRFSRTRFARSWAPASKLDCVCRGSTTLRAACVSMRPGSCAAVCPRSRARLAMGARCGDSWSAHPPQMRSHGRSARVRNDRWRRPFASPCSTSHRSQRAPRARRRSRTRSTWRASPTELGYHRYWVAEHHGGPMLAGPAPRGADRADRSRDIADSRGQRRGDAAPLQPLQGRGDVQPAGGAVPRSHRPGTRARGRHRSADHLRPTARPASGRAR